MTVAGDRRRTRSGAASLELALLTPLFLLLLDFAVLGGRLTESQSRVDEAAHAAARAASLQRTAPAAAAAAHQTVSDTFASVGGCQSSSVTVDSSTFHPGGAVTVSVSCVVALGDLSWLPLPGTRTVSGTAVSPVDTYRGTGP